ncbi:MAG: class I SAM-dependent methyltransferase [Nitrososphaerota archaeon]
MKTPMLETVYRFLEKHVPEAIPLPFTRIYDLFARTRLMKDFYREVASEVASEIYSGKILDVGTGPGYLPIEIAKLAPNIEVIGIDLSNDMVRIARKNAEKAKLLEKVKFMVENANEMTFEDSLFDLVISTGSLHHWKRPIRIINEIYRVFKDEGNAWIFDLRSDIPK